MQYPSLIVAFSCLLFVSSSDGSPLSVGPYEFQTDAEYDNNFKSAAPHGIPRNNEGYLEVAPVSDGVAIFDTSAFGGTQGMGGTSGSNANNDYSDFVVSGTIANSNSLYWAQVAFLLRLDDAGNNGYLAQIRFPSLTQVEFRLVENSKLAYPETFPLNYLTGNLIFSQTISLATPIAYNEGFYSYSVSAIGNTFNFNFSNGLATASFTDDTPSRLSGQVGIDLAAYTMIPNATEPPIDTYTRLDNFAITAIPEPNVVSLIVFSLFLFPIALRIHFGNRTRRCS